MTAYDSVYARDDHSICNVLTIPGQQIIEATGRGNRDMQCVLIRISR